METKTITANELAKAISSNTYHNHVGNAGYDQRPYIVGVGCVNGVAGYTGFADGRHDEEWDADQDAVLRQIQEMRVGQCLVLPDYSGCHHNHDIVYLKTNSKGDFMLLGGVECANPSRLFGGKFLENVSGFEIVQIVGKFDGTRYKTGEKSYLRTNWNPDCFVEMVETLREKFDIVEIEITDYARDPREILNY